jgi:NADH-quinone oxidoreductase subunit H
MLNELSNSYIWQQIFVLPGAHIEWWAEVVRSLLRVLMAVVGTLGCVPVLVWGERRLLGLLQGRLGPNRVGPMGLLQPIADATKLMFKEDIIPTNVDRTLYIIAPGVALISVIMSATVLPWNGSPEWGTVAPGLNIGILFLLGVASVEVYGTILAGWSSNNKYSLLGGLRASSQVISYELGMGLSIIAVLLMAGTLGTQDLVNHQGLIHHARIAGTSYWIPEQTWIWSDMHTWSGFWNWHVCSLFPFGLIATMIYLISMIAETNRAPFDLPEAETELVAGFHTEYSSFKFAMFFMGEYANMVIVSAIAVTLFFGGYMAPFGFLSGFSASAGSFLPAWIIDLVNTGIGFIWYAAKLFTLIGLFILIRASFPRLRYDMLMKFGWKGMLPVALVNVVLIALALALQQQYGIFAGWLGAVAAGIVICAILFFGMYRSYVAARRKPKSTELVRIRRKTVIVPTPSASPEA